MAYYIKIKNKWHYRTGYNQKSLLNLIDLRTAPNKDIIHQKGGYYRLLQRYKTNLNKLFLKAKIDYLSGSTIEDIEAQYKNQYNTLYDKATKLAEFIEAKYNDTIDKDFINNMLK